MDDSAPDFVPHPAEGLRYRNVVAMFASRVQRSAHQPALRHKQGGAWRTCSWIQWQQQSRTLAAGLRGLGVGPGDRVGIVARTRFEWVIADLAIAMAGAVSVPVYPSLTPDQGLAILEDSGAIAVVVEDLAALGGGPMPAALREAVVIGGPADRAGPEADAVASAAPRAHGWEAVMEAGRQALDEGDAAEALDTIAQRLGPDDEFTYVYTSGATGEPKGAVLTHRAMVYETWAIKNAVPLGHEDEQLLVLPLAHIFARHLVWATVEQGAVSAFTEGEDRVYANFIEVAPTFVAAVPRMYERAYDRLRQHAQTNGIARAVFERAVDVGRRVSRRQQRGEPVPTRLALQHAVAERVVLRRVREQFGGRVRFFVSGGAPLSAEVAELFHAIGILVLEGYGLSETCGATHVNRPNRFRFGTVGPALPGCEIRLADDGEILVRGHNVMVRYHGRPEATAAAFDDDGWLRTGDIGELRDGFLRITDRKKDLIKTSTGKYVAPLMVEKRLRRGEGIADATVYGDARPYVVALVSLDESVMLARSDREGLGCQSYADLAAHPRVREIVQAHVDEFNRGLSRHERVRAFHIVSEPFTEATGELTPTRKVKRSVVLERYATAIDGLYAAPANADPRDPATKRPSFSP